MNDTQPVAAIGYGSDRRPSAEGDPSTSTLAASGSTVLAGGVAWEGEIAGCVSPTKRGWVCTAPRANGTDKCVGHLRQAGEL